MSVHGLIEGRSVDELAHSPASMRALDRLRVIVRHVAQPGSPTAQNPALLFELTLRAEALSSSRRFIRCDARAGDELHGWQRCDSIVVEEVLGRLREDGTTVDVIERDAAQAA